MSFYPLLHEAAQVLHSYKGRARDPGAGGGRRPERPRPLVHPAAVNAVPEEYLGNLPGPLRVRDFAGHARSMGLPELRPPAALSSLLTAPIRHRGQGLGHLCGGLPTPEGGGEQLLEILTFRRGDGRQMGRDEFPLAQALSTGETVRAGQIIQVPDVGSVTTLVSAMRSDYESPKCHGRVPYTQSPGQPRPSKR